MFTILSENCYPKCPLKQLLYRISNDNLKPQDSLHYSSVSFVKVTLKLDHY